MTEKAFGLEPAAHSTINPFSSFELSCQPSETVFVAVAEPVKFEAAAGAVAVAGLALTIKSVMLCAGTVCAIIPPLKLASAKRFI